MYSLELTTSSFDAVNVFPSLVELGVINIRCPGGIAKIFHPTNFPKLRGLAWSTQVDTLGNTDVLTSLADQLEALSVDLCHAKSWTPDLLARLEEKTLFDSDWDDVGTKFPSCRYLRLAGFANDDVEVTLTDRLSFLGFLLSNSKPGSLPSVLYLPLWLEPLYHFLNIQQYGSCTLKKMFDSNGIEVVWEEEASAWDYDSAISVDFWRRMKGKK